MRSNQLTSLPNSIGCLSKLKLLNVSGNFIESLPKTIENCRFNFFTSCPFLFLMTKYCTHVFQFHTSFLLYHPRSLISLSSIFPFDLYIFSFLHLFLGCGELFTSSIITLLEDAKILRSVDSCFGLPFIFFWHVMTSNQVDD